MSTSLSDDLFGHTRIVPSEQEQLWAEQRTACWHDWLLTLFVWATLTDVAEKRRMYRDYVRQHGEIAAKSLAAAVVKAKDAAFRSKTDIDEIQYQTYATMEKTFRLLMRWRRNHS